MRTKGDITVFSDGTMNVYNRSLAEELWYDYKDFAHRAAKYRKMNKKDAELSARRYERGSLCFVRVFLPSSRQLVQSRARKGMLSDRYG